MNLKESRLFSKLLAYTFFVLSIICSLTILYVYVFELYRYTIAIFCILIAMWIIALSIISFTRFLMKKSLFPFFLSTYITAIALLLIGGFYSGFDHGYTFLCFSPLVLVFFMLIAIQKVINIDREIKKESLIKEE